MGKGKGSGGGGMSAEEREKEKEDARIAREKKRAAKRANHAAKTEGMDALQIAQMEMGKSGPDDAQAQMEAEELERDEEVDAAFSKKGKPKGAEAGSGGVDFEDASRSKMALCIDWMLEPPRRPPNEWQTYRQKELADFIREMRRGLMVYMPKIYDDILIWHQTRRTLQYWGEFDGKKERDGRGICFWPDPPYGGGESYHGLWRCNQPNGHGLFRWYDGDMYMGEWNVGKMQGYGVYKYGPTGPYAKDIYEGTYFNALRQGSGVYKYAPRGPDGQGAVYMGEWLRGMMHGQGILVYQDGETYIGQWILDKKQGFGQYVWGTTAGDVAGDKYQGEFAGGYTHGLGKTTFADGGFHKGRYVKGKLNGYGVLRVADGWEYTGTWKEDELHGEVVCNYIFGTGQGKEVQEYDMGEYVRSRPYDPSSDWGEIESMGMSEARSAEKAAEEALSRIPSVQKFGKRAKESQALAKDAADEARYMTRSCLAFKEFLMAWYGLMHYVIAEEV